MRRNLMQKREKANLTKAAIADKIGITERQYQRLEAGTSDGSIKVWQELKRLLRAKSIDWLLEQSDENLSRQ